MNVAHIRTYTARLTAHVTYAAVMIYVMRALRLCFTIVDVDADMPPFFTLVFVSAFFVSSLPLRLSFTCFAAMPAAAAALR